MKALINSKTRLNAVGWVGAVLFVGAPAVGTFNYMSAVERAARSMRLGFPPSGMNDAYFFIAVTGIVALAGLVMVIAGRTYDHVVEISKD